MNSRTWWLIFLVLFAGLALAVTLVFREAVRDRLVLPLLQFFYFLRQLWSSIDSDRIWGVFILVLYVVMLLSLPVLKHPIPSEGASEVGYAHSGRLSHWRHVIHRLRSSQRVTRFSTLELKILAVNIVAFRQQCSLRQAELWLQAEENRPLVPEQMSWLFRKNPQAVVLAPKGLAPVGLAARIWQRLKIRLRIYPGLPAASPPVTNVEIESIPQFLGTQLEIESIIQFLETQLEVEHDQHPRL